MGSVHYLAQGAKSSARARARMHRTGVTPSGDRLWGDEELMALKLLHGTMTLAEIGKRLGRSYSGTRNKAQELGLSPKRHVWTGAEVSRLRRTYSSGTKEDLAAAFPGRSIVYLARAASHHGIRRQRLGFKKTGIAIIDQVRARAFELGYSMVDLDDLASSGAYFQRQHWVRGQIDFRAINRAVKAMDGHLVASWHDPDHVESRASVRR